ncbi:hypothetical protein KIL84_012002 [Mauremys mutica]|uniref:Uncharacterized protein n=1 Tax=Mauremys mutica TaxID=74926 RepID=A0A9D3XFM3_9SAUR|nr:hypothetical protein KIL84_012002 [Mauremys mutica]
MRVPTAAAIRRQLLCSAVRSGTTSVFWLKTEAAAELPLPQKRTCHPNGTRTSPAISGGNSINHQQQMNPANRDSVRLQFQDRYKPMDQTKYNSLTNAIAKWIGMDCRPLNTVNDRGLIDALRIVSSNQSLTLPSRGTTASRIHDLYHNGKTIRLELLKYALAVA